VRLPVPDAAPPLDLSTSSPLFACQSSSVRLLSLIFLGPHTRYRIIFLSFVLFLHESLLHQSISHNTAAPIACYVTRSFLRRETNLKTDTPILITIKIEKKKKKKQNRTKLLQQWLQGHQTVIYSKAFAISVERRWRH
jgi:hypothetical protein